MMSYDGITWYWDTQEQHAYTILYKQGFIPKDYQYIAETMFVQTTVPDSNNKEEDTESFLLGMPKSRHGMKYVSIWLDRGR